MLSRLMERYIEDGVRQSAKHELHASREEAEAALIAEINNMPLWDALKLLALYEEDDAA